MRLQRDCLALAKKLCREDPHLANYILRDLQITARAELDDLAWELHRDGATSTEDVLGLIGKLDAFLLREQR